MTDNEFVNELWEQIKNIKNSQILFWGNTNISLELIDKMNANENKNQVCGIIEFKEKTREYNLDLTTIDGKTLKELSFDTLIVTNNIEKENILREFSKIDARKPRIIIAGMNHIDFKDSLYRETLETSAVSPRAFGYPNMLIHLYQSLCHIAKNKLEGDVAEFGVYRGGTTVFLARIMQSIGITAKIFAFDTFSGFPKTRSVLDMYNDPHDEFFKYDEVKQYCSPFNIELIKGDINETCLRLENKPLMLSFFDTDNYSPAKNTLELCYKQTVRGGIIAFDHYFCDKRWMYTLGERMAAIDFLMDKNVINLYGTGIFIKTK